MAISGKVIAHVIADRLHNLLESPELYQIFEDQDGFRRRRGTRDAIFALKMALHRRREHQKDSWVLFIDLIKAFDTVDRPAMLKVLLKFGAPPSLCKVVEKLYTNCEIELSFGSCRGTIPSTIGVKQGDNMAPVLFIFFMQAAMRSLEKHWEAAGIKKPSFHSILDSVVAGRRYSAKRHALKCEFWRKLYADDTAFIFEDRADIEAGAELTLRHLRRWGLAMHISGKTEAMYIPQLVLSRQ